MSKKKILFRCLEQRSTTTMEDVTQWVIIIIMNFAIFQQKNNYIDCFLFQNCPIAFYGWVYWKLILILLIKQIYLFIMKVHKYQT